MNIRQWHHAICIMACRSKYVLVISFGKARLKRRNRLIYYKVLRQCSILWLFHDINPWGLSCNKNLLMVYIDQPHAVLKMETCKGNCVMLYWMCLLMVSFRLMVWMATFAVIFFFARRRLKLPTEALQRLSLSLHVLHYLLI